jgi:Lon protease-like protein
MARGPTTLLGLFPLPTVVLFPGVLLPLHVFEPRYRALVRDALESDRRLGMVLLRPGWETDYEGRPPIHHVGCAGVIVHANHLEDGRYNIVLRGLERFRVASEDHARAYRRAAIELLPETAADEAAGRAVRELRRLLETRLGLSASASGEAGVPRAVQLAELGDEVFVHTLAQHLNLEPIEKQALLERDTLRLRAELLVELLEMKRLEATFRAGPNVSH